MRITIKRGITAEVVAECLEEWRIPEPKAKEIPALFCDRTNDIAFGAFVESKIIGILLGRRISTTIWVHLIHSIGSTRDDANRCLLEDLEYYAKQFGFNVRLV